MFEFMGNSTPWCIRVQLLYREFKGTAQPHLQDVLDSKNKCSANSGEGMSLLIAASSLSLCNIQTNVVNLSCSSSTDTVSSSSSLPSSWKPPVSLGSERGHAAVLQAAAERLRTSISGILTGQHPSIISIHHSVPFSWSPPSLPEHACFWTLELPQTLLSKFNLQRSAALFWLSHSFVYLSGVALITLPALLSSSPHYWIN